MLLLAVGCTPLQWVKADATPEQAEVDNRQCQHIAWREASWRSMAYHRSYGPHYYRDQFGRPVLVSPYGPFAEATDRFMDEARLADFCMRAKGYQLTPVEK